MTQNFFKNLENWGRFFKEEIWVYKKRFLKRLKLELLIKKIPYFFLEQWNHSESSKSDMFFVFHKFWRQNTIFRRKCSPKPENGPDLVEMLMIEIRTSNFWLEACLNDVSGDYKNMNIFVIKSFFRKCVTIYRAKLYLRVPFLFSLLCVASLTLFRYTK